ncbi:unnamed protein product [Rotaria sordida]|uniref:Uncharacterized protein n=1 Tax=Rotaria sordida TaxID=392033 RepID=A0A815WY24_9BILA|nr:unnamed protein product [Rotaria sordida]CAF1549199.1 unnamed protein product [Rotaria sordida]
MVKIIIVVISIEVVIGIILNVLNIGTFVQRSTHDSGSGFYLLASSCINLLTIITLMCKMIVLLSIEQNRWSCSLLEFLLKWWPTSCEWLGSCVAIERTMVVKRQTQFSRPRSKYLAKWVIPGVVICTAAICSFELVLRQVVTDTNDERPCKDYLLQAHCIQILEVLLLLLDITGDTNSIPPNHLAEILTEQDTNHIKYRTFEKMCNERISNENNTKSLRDIISGKALVPESNQVSANKPSILLIDQVDVFCSYEFGIVRFPVVHIYDKYITEMQKNTEKYNEW